MLPHLQHVQSSDKGGDRIVPYLDHVVLIGGDDEDAKDHSTLSYRIFMKKGSEIHQGRLDRAKKLVTYHDVCNLQYTSGTTGWPKAAMLTHQ